MDLSIIIPAYNMQKYIAACLRSVTVCPKEDIKMECIVVNDGSNDDTSAIVKRYIQRDNRIKLIEKKNGGVSDTRNEGLSHANGRYIMFLDADDRLCEDAWENIVPIVKNECLDFAAYSYITLYENGKMKAQMLPISDIVSDDEKEAKRLMYADSVFNTCWGKLFRSDIIKSNNIVFRTDIPVGEDFLFVAEYFGHCKSFMMTKAMIVYYLQRSGSAMRSYSMKERLGFTKILYEFNEKAAQSCDDAELIQSMKVYYLKVITNLFYEYAKVYGKEKNKLESMYVESLKNETVIKILDDVNSDMVVSKIKKYELKLLKSKNISKLVRYFSFKAKL